MLRLKPRAPKEFRAVGATLALMAGLLVFTAPFTMAHAANACEDVFSSRIELPAPSLGVRTAKVLDSFLTLVGFGDISFRMDHFRDASTRYQAELKSPANALLVKPTSPEEKLAFIEVASRLDGQTGIMLEAWMQNANRDSNKLVRSALKKLDFEKGLQISRVEEAFSLVYTMTHSDPLTLRALLGDGLKTKFDNLKNFRSRVLPRAVHNTIRQRAENELASNSLTEAVQRLGLMASPSVRDRLMRRMREYPNVMSTIHNVALNSVTYMMTKAMSGHGLIMHVPSYSLLKTKRLSPELAELMRERGFDAAYPLLKKHYGNRAEFDAAWSVGRRIATAAIMGYLLSQILDVIPMLVPYHLQNENDSYLVMLEKIFDQWVAVINYRLGRTQGDTIPGWKELDNFADDYAKDDGDLGALTQDAKP